MRRNNLNHVEIMATAKQYASLHTQALVREYISKRNDSNILRLRMNELAAILRPTCGTDAIRVAESLVVDAALQAVAEGL